MRRGQNTEAIAKLMEATRNNNLFFGLNRKRRARYAFIVAQLLEQQRDYNRAILYYQKTISLKPNYDMVFYSKIKVARLMDSKRGNPQRTKKDLLRMTKEFKNSDYYDVIYYTLGELEERDRNIPLAITYYKKSVQTSVNNANQKALSFLKLGEINFDLTNYEPAEAYYDSAVTALPKDHPDYDRIFARKKTLETLVGHIRTISREDSLQRIAKMSEADRTKYIDMLIAKMKEEEERKQREQEAAKNANNGSGQPTNNNIPSLGSGEATSFYFYNPNTVALGVADFTRKWGNRKLEDNWRRSNKAISVDDLDNSGKPVAGGPAKKSGLTNAQLREAYLKDLPLNDTLIDKSNKKIIKAYYMMGSIYKEELNNSAKTIYAFETLNKRYPGNEYQLNTYYMLYRMYLSEKNEPKADYYKNKILGEYPDSQFALLIKNPNYAEELVTQKGEAEGFYTETYNSYRAGNYSQSLRQANEGLKKFGKNDYQPKFEFIKAMSLGYLHGIDTLEYSLKMITAKYPNADIVPISNDILLSIKKKKQPALFAQPEPGTAKTDTFNLAIDKEHFVIGIAPDDTKEVDAFKLNVSSFNGVYYGDRKFDINSNLFGQSNQLVIIKTFPGAKEAMTYIENILVDPDVFKGDVKKEDFLLYAISPDNLQLLYKRKNQASYKLFYEDNYKKINTKN
jgi:tetratricopeptide (TPR) repeat protein